jgi:hypothetical protein
VISGLFGTLKGILKNREFASADEIEAATPKHGTISLSMTHRVSSTTGSSVFFESLRMGEKIFMLESAIEPLVASNSATSILEMLHWPTFLVVRW